MIKIKVFLQTIFLFLKKNKDEVIFFPSAMDEPNLWWDYKMFDPNVKKIRIWTWHKFDEKIWREKKEKSHLTSSTDHFYFPFFQVCLSAKMQNETDLIFPPIYLKVMWFYAINPITVAHFWAKTCNNTQWVKINFERASLFSCTFSGDISLTVLYYCGLSLPRITRKNIKIKC